MRQQKGAELLGRSRCYLGHNGEVGAEVSSSAKQVGRERAPSACGSWPLRGETWAGRAEIHPWMTRG